MNFDRFLSTVKNKAVIALSKVEIFWKLSASKYFFTRKKLPLTIITAADTSHYKSLINLLSSISKYEKSVEVSVWDLGFTSEELASINKYFPNYKISKFEFAKYPEHFNLQIRAGEYAWKPAIIFEESKKSLGLILWLDAGDLITKKLYWIRKFIEFSGFYSPYSSGSIIDWTHPEMLKKFRITGSELFKRNLNGAIVGFDVSQNKSKELLKAWFDCALDKNCIAPIGSSRDNHRQDQAALTCLSYAYGLAPKGLSAVNRKSLGIIQHQDV